MDDKENSDSPISPMHLSGDEGDSPSAAHWTRTSDSDSESYGDPDLGFDPEDPYDLIDPFIAAAYH